MKNIVREDVIHLFGIFNNDRVTRNCIVFVVIICFFPSLIFGYSFGLLLLFSFCFGLFLCYLLVKFKKQTSNVLQLLVGFCRSQSFISKKQKIVQSCSICDDLSCKRHQGILDNAPWENISLDQNLNQALEKFYNRILNEFVSSWYESLSKDEKFTEELKYNLKFATASLLKRVLEVDIISLISTKLLPCAIRHLDDYVYIEQIAKLKTEKVHKIVVDYLGKRLHFAVTSRNNEISYLQEVTEALLPYALPKVNVHCRNYAVLIREIVAGWVLLPLMDVLSDPNIINYLIILAANHIPKKYHQKKHPPKEEILQNFLPTENTTQKKSYFYRDLNEIKENTELLYTFMQFLKNEDQVHLLQFCLDVDDFNNKLMAPHLSKKVLEELYEEAGVILKEYLSADSVNFVKCSNEISEDLKVLLKDGILSIAKIKVSGPLIRAYKEVFDELEERWLPIFFQSEQFYNHLCGPRVTPDYSSTSSMKRNKRTEGSLLPTKLTGFEKLKTALKNTPVDGALFTNEVQPGSLSCELFSDVDVSVPICYSILRDISDWQISISSYVSLNKVIYFHVNVKRTGPIDKDMEIQRVVLRKDQDFFTLKAKLIEFHGENEICDSPLPARKVGSDIGTRMLGYERFLKKLLQNSALKGSDLLYSFLTVEEDFSMFISTCGAPQTQDLSNIYQSVAQKLRKEKGQHLDSFMQVFMGSIGAYKGGRFLVPEIGDEVEVLNALHVPAPKTYRNRVFNDNFGVTTWKRDSIPTSVVIPIGFVHCFFYLGRFVFRLPHFVVKSYVAVCHLISEAVETVCHFFLQHGLNAGLSQDRLKELIEFLEEIVFDDMTDPPTTLELEDRKKRASEILSELSKKFPYKLLGNNFFEGLRRLWEVTQHPHYNKQLTYQLLDIVLVELYPNILKQVK